MAENGGSRVQVRRLSNGQGLWNGDGMERGSAAFTAPCQHKHHHTSRQPMLASNPPCQLKTWRWQGPADSRVCQSKRQVEHVILVVICLGQLVVKVLHGRVASTSSRRVITLLAMHTGVSCPLPQHNAASAAGTGGYAYRDIPARSARLSSHTKCVCCG